METNPDDIDDPDYRKIAQLLDGAKGTVVDDRGDTHGHPRENLRHTAGMWSAYLETDVTPTDVAMCMVMQKISRQKKGKPVADHYEDMNGYSSIGGALALNDRCDDDSGCGDDSGVGVRPEIREVVRGCLDRKLGDTDREVHGA